MTGYLGVAVLAYREIADSGLTWPTLETAAMAILGPPVTGVFFGAMVSLYLAMGAGFDLAELGGDVADIDIGID